LLLDRLRTQDPNRNEIDRKSAAAMFDWLLAEPLHLGIDGGRRSERYIIVIDALDETIRDGRSALAEVLAESCQKLPEWIAVVVTSRPEPAILPQFAGLKPQVIASDSDDNLNDLRAFARRTLTFEGQNAGETDARVERMVAASQEIFYICGNCRKRYPAGLSTLPIPTNSRKVWSDSMSDGSSGNFPMRLPMKPSFRFSKS
jgi:hypothetical protein